MPRKPPRLWQFRFTDMLEVCKRIQRYSKDQTATSLANDQKTVDALVRCFEILGEASNHVPIEIQSQHPQLPWKEMVSMRNELIHGYFDLSPEVLLSTASKNIAPLMKELELIVSRFSPDTPQ